MRLGRSRSNHRAGGRGRRWVTRGLLVVVAAVPTTMVVASVTAAPAGATAHRDDGGGGNGGDDGGGGPILECSYKDTKTGKYNTLWGYTNTSEGTWSVPVGQYNQFSSPGANAGQPTTFLKGTHDNVFIVTSTGSSSWTLGFTTLTAPGKACATNPVPFLPKGVPSWLTIGALMGAVLAGGLLVQRRLERAATI